MEDLGRKCRGRADRLLEGDDLFVQRVADLARECAVSAGVRPVASAGNVRRAVRGRRDEVVPHDGADVVLAHAEADGLRAAVPLDVDDDLQGRGLLTDGDRGKVLADAFGARGVTGDADRRAAVAALEPVLDLAAELRGPRGVVGQTVEALDPFLLGPGGDHHRRQLGARRHVGILVGADRLLGLAGFVDPGAGRGRQAPARLARGLQVRDVDRQPRLLADRQDLVDRPEQSLPFVADVAGVNPAVLRNHACQRDQLGGLGESARQVDQAGGHPPGAGLHALFNQHLHPLELLLGRRAVGVPHHRGTDGAVGDQVDDVGPGATRVDRVEQLGDVERTAAAIAGDDRGHPLRLVIPVRPRPRRDDAVIRMRVQVDEARRHDPGRGVNDLGAGIHGERPDRDDPLTPDRHVRPAPIGAGAVDDGPILEHPIGRDRLLGESRAHGDQTEHRDKCPQASFRSHGVPLCGSDRSSGSGRAARAGRSLDSMRAVGGKGRVRCATRTPC